MTTLPDKDKSTDKELIQILGPDGIKDNFQYDAETNTYYSRRGTIIIPTSHGFTHVGDDPVPAATIYRDGLMSKDDKAKLDALVQTRIGVVGFSGAGFPDDGGFLDGTILFGSSDGIVIEKVGNLIRWTMNAPVPITCNVEECAKIYWIQDETQSDKIRPPVCAGKLFGATVPGELDVVIYPDNLIVNSSNPVPVLAARSSYPGFKIKRYVNAFATQDLASLDLILERANDTTSKVGWSMTPGPLGIAENVWFMGMDVDGNQIRFEMNPAPTFGSNLPDSQLLGSIVYNGHTLTRQMAIITNYTSGTTSLNEYECRFWSINNETAVGDSFVAVNAWSYNSDEALIKDRIEDILPIGTLVEIWEFQVQELNGNRIVRRYFSKQPKLNPSHLFSLSGLIKFGHILGSREEVSPGPGETDLTAFVEQSEDLRLIERDQWGITGFEDPVLLSDDLDETSSIDVSLDVAEVLGENTFLPSPNVEVRVTDTALIVNGYDGYYAEFTNLSDLAGRTFFVYQNSTNSITIGGIDSSELNTAIAIAGGLPTVITLFSKSEISAPSGIPVNNRFLAQIDSSRPALVVENLDPDSDRELPVFLWHRTSHKNFYLRAKLGMPLNSQFPPIDILLRAPVDSFDDVFMQVISRGHYSSGPFVGRSYIKVSGVSFRDLPKSGALRILTGIYRDTIWKYDYKIAFGSSVNGSGLILVGQVGSDFRFDEDFIPGDSYSNPTGTDVVTGTDPTSVDPMPDKTTIVQLLRHDYSSPCLRIESSVNDNIGSESVQMQFKVGMLDMSEPYELNLTNSKDNYVRGLRPGQFTVSRIFTQDGFIETGAETVTSEPSAFVVYKGNSVAGSNGSTELFNDLEVIYKDDQLWIFWNGLLVTPDPVSSAALEEPVVVNTAYFPLISDMETGKVALRMWPGAVVRQVEIRDQLIKKSEYMYGQLEILTDSGTGTA